MTVLQALAIGLTLFGGTLGAYPESCPPDPVLPNYALNPSTLQQQVANNASLLFAWQLVSVTGMGTPYKGHPCNDSNIPFDMTCIVPDILSNKPDFIDKMKLIGVDGELVHAVLAERVGCAANLDTFVAKQHVRGHLDGLITAFASATIADDKRRVFCEGFDKVCMQELLGSTAIQTAICAQAGVEPPSKAQAGSVDPLVIIDSSTLISHIFAWQLFGTVRSKQYVVSACTHNLTSIENGIDLLGMNVTAFTDYFCHLFSQDTPLSDPSVVLRQTDWLTSLLYGVALFGLSHENEYQCELCGDTGLDRSRFEGVGLNEEKWEDVRRIGCGENGYEAAKKAVC